MTIICFHHLIKLLLVLQQSCQGRIMFCLCQVFRGGRRGKDVELFVPEAVLLYLNIFQQL